MILEVIFPKFSSKIWWICSFLFSIITRKGFSDPCHQFSLSFSFFFNFIMSIKFIFYLLFQSNIKYKCNKVNVNPTSKIYFAALSLPEIKLNHLLKQNLMFSRVHLTYYIFDYLNHIVCNIKSQFLHSCKTFLKIIIIRIKKIQLVACFRLSIRSSFVLFDELYNSTFTSKKQTFLQS